MAALVFASSKTKLAILASPIRKLAIQRLFLCSALINFAAFREARCLLILFYVYFFCLFCASAYKNICLSFLFALWCTKNAELLFRVRHLTFFQERKAEEGETKPCLLSGYAKLQTSPKTHSCRYTHLCRAPCSTCSHMRAAGIQFRLLGFSHTDH